MQGIVVGWGFGCMGGRNEMERASDDQREREGGRGGASANAVGSLSTYASLVHSTVQLGENGKGPAVLLIKGVQSSPPVDNMLCGHFAASFMCEITGNGDKLISNQV